jgi:hypothetical protein
LSLRRKPYAAGHPVCLHKVPQHTGISHTSHRKGLRSHPPLPPCSGGHHCCGAAARPSSPRSSSLPQHPARRGCTVWHRRSHALRPLFGAAAVGCLAGGRCSCGRRRRQQRGCCRSGSGGARPCCRLRQPALAAATDQHPGRCVCSAVSGLRKGCGRAAAGLWPLCVWARGSACLGEIVAALVVLPVLESLSLLCLQAPAPTELPQAAQPQQALQAWR